MEVLKKIELRDYQTYLYEDSSSLDDYWKKKEKKLKVLSNNEFLLGDETDDYVAPGSYIRGSEWKFKEEYRTENAFLENYGNPVASVRLKKFVLVLEKSEDKISLKYFTYVNQRNVGNKWFVKATCLTYATYNIKTNCFYYGVSNNYHKKRKVGGRTFSKNVFSKKSLESFVRYVKSELSYVIVPNMIEKEAKNRMVDEYVVEFLRNIPTLKYNGLLSFDEMLFKNYLDLNNIKYPDNWNIFIEMSPLPLKREYKKNKNRLVDTFMYKNELVGDKLKKLLHVCDKTNITYLKEVYRFFGEDFVRSQDDSIILKILNASIWSGFQQNPPFKNKKCRQNAFSVYVEMLMSEDVLYTFADHIRMYYFLNKFETVKWKSKTMDEFRKEHVEWTDKQEFYTKGKYNRLYPQQFIDGIKSMDLDGYFPVLLKSSDEYIGESSQQNNCVKTYINRAESLIISLRKDCPEGEERATIEYKIFGSKDNKMRLWRTQTLGRFNQKLTSEWDKPVEMLDKGIYKMVNDGILGFFNVEVEVGGKKIISGTKFDESANNYLCWTDNAIHSITNNYYLNF